MKDRFGGVEQLKRTAVEDPFGAALDVAPIARPVSMAALAGKTGRLANLGRAMSSPITAAAGAAAGTAKGAGRGIGFAAQQGAGLATGVDPGIFTTAREALTGGAVPREAFKSARRGIDDPKAIPKGVESVVDGLRMEKNRVFKEAKSQMDQFNVRMTPGKLAGLRERIVGGVASEFGLKFTPTGAIDFKNIPGLATAGGGAQKKITQAMGQLQNVDGSLSSLWDARMNIDTLAEVLRNKKRVNKAGAVVKSLRARVSKELEDLGGSKFKKLNSDYKAASTLIDDFMGVTSAGGKPQTQINAISRSIKEQARFSEDILQRVEAQSGVPLRAIAAGAELSEGAARGLIGRSRMANVIFAGGAVLMAEPWILAGLLFTSPRFVGRLLEFSVATERAVRAANQAVQRLMAIPGAQQLAEQGLTIGAIINQLDRESPRSTLGALGASP
jgi:hypothetical protein